jgi:hypothetical protein
VSLSGALDLSPALEELTIQERIIVESKLKGMTLAACAAAAGATLEDVRSLVKQKHIVTALTVGQAICEEHSRVTRERVSAMLLNAYDHADTATEMVLAARELAKLHGLNAPTQVQIDHNVSLRNVRTEADIRKLSLEELERLAVMRGNEVLEGEFTALPAPVPVATEEVSDGEASR